MNAVLEKQYPVSKEDYLKIKAYIREATEKGTLSAYDVFCYNAIRSLPLDRGFTQFTNPTKLHNGQISRINGLMQWLRTRHSYSRRTAMFHLTVEQTDAVFAELR